MQRWSVTEGDIYRVMPTVVYRKSNDKWDFAESSGTGHQTPSISVAIDRRPKLVLKDATAAQERVIFDPNPDFDKFAFGRVEVIHWTGKKGESLIGGLVYPTAYKEGQRYPLVIQTHGFNPEIFLVDGSFTTSFAAQELANQGVAVLQIGESPLYEESNRGPEWGSVLLSQVESGVDYLNNRGIIDQQNVALVGFSVTGFTVWYALTHSSYPFRAATASEGNDQGYWSYLAMAEPQWAASTEQTYGGPPWGDRLQKWIEESISFNYQKVHTPIRVESESNPGEVLAEWEHFYALKRLNKPVELIVEAHGDHPVQKPWDRMTSQQGNVDWLLFWLKGLEDPDPAKRDQYGRWHELKKVSEADLAKRHSQNTNALQSLIRE
jgi:dipeptidyl aminopeptidase/acylaminoacyl peptidase